MKTLLGSQKPPLSLHYYPPEPCLSLHNPTQTLLLLRPTTTTTWRHRATNAKGFGGSGAGTSPKQVVTTRNKDSGNRNDGGDHLPQVVLERIIKRILVSFGVPLATGIVLMGLFGAVKEQQLWDVPRWVPALTLFLTFGGSAVGIAYGPLSASWDEERKGSLLGVEEAKQNWVQIWEEEEEEDG